MECCFWLIFVLRKWFISSSSMFPSQSVLSSFSKYSIYILPYHRHIQGNPKSQYYLFISYNVHFHYMYLRGFGSKNYRLNKTTMILQDKGEFLYIYYYIYFFWSKSYVCYRYWILNKKIYLCLYMTRRRWHWATEHLSGFIVHKRISTRKVWIGS